MVTTKTLFKVKDIVPSRQIGWIGVDIGVATVKLAQVQRERNGWRLAARCIVPLPEESNADLAGGLQRSLLQIIRPLLQSSDAFCGPKMACSLPAAFLQYRKLDLPAGSHAEQRDMIAQELANDHQDIDNTQFEFWESNAGESLANTGMRQYTVVSTPRSLVDGIAGSFLKSKLECEVIDVLPFTLARAIQMSSQAAPNQPTIALDWGHKSTMFVVVDDGHPVFVRCLRDCGMSQIIEALSRETSLTARDCFPLLENYGLSSPKINSETSGIQELISAMASETISRIASEIQKTISFVVGRNKKRAPEKLILFGGGAAVRNSSAVLASRLGMHVETWGLPDVFDDGIVSGFQAALLGPAAALSALGFEK